MMRRRDYHRRDAFTFVELLIVVAIVALLVALLMAGVMRVLGLQVRTETTSDITQMTQAMGAAKAGYNNMEYFPSQLILYSDINNYRIGTTNLEKQTANAFRAMFGKRFISNGGMVNWGVPNGTVLQGSECLVFYLGGIVQGGRATGFSKNPTDPTAAGGERLGPYFNFKVGRLVALPARQAASYLDPNGIPYVYFGALSDNNYDATHAHLGVSPYFASGSTPTKWLNPNTFQIISAGKDKAFGPGGAINTLVGYTGGAGADDIANFSQAELGNKIE
jgi:prepilin-type N-terminal cleavage/methylation domain-containing protein